MHLAAVLLSAFALGSQQKYARAAKDGFFQSEIHPASVPQGRNKPDLSVADNIAYGRPDATRGESRMCSAAAGTPRP